MSSLNVGIRKWEDALNAHRMLKELEPAQVVWTGLTGIDKEFWICDFTPCVESKYEMTAWSS